MAIPGSLAGPVGAKLAVVQPQRDAVKKVGTGYKRIRNGFKSPAVRAGLLAGVLCFALSCVLFRAWVHHEFAGFYYGPFLTGTETGIPALAADEGIKTVVEGVGGQGQYYYYAANDVLMKGDAAAHMDDAAARYRRIAVPLMAKGVSDLAGLRITSPGVYHLIQLGLFSAGCGVLVWWLRSNGNSAWMALAWAGSFGALNALSLGLPDAAAAGVFVVSLVALSHRRAILYVPATALLCLTHEAYTIYAFFVAAGTLLGLISWRDNGFVWQNLLMLVPLAVAAGWAAFVANRLGVPFEASAVFGPTMEPIATLKGKLATAWYAGDSLALRMSLVGGAVLATAFYMGTTAAHRNGALLAALPVACLTTVAGPALVIAVMALPYHHRWGERFVLTVSFIAGIQALIETKVWA